MNPNQVGQAPMMFGEAAAQPLSGLRVVEVGVWHAGPGGSAIFAELGAEVIKVEDLAGDPERHTGKFGPLRTGDFDREEWTVLYDLSNRGKKNISIDLRTEQGRKILAGLVAEADIFFTNLRHNSKPRMGIDYATLSRINPQLIHVNVTGFGPEGELADQGAFDTLGQAMSGMMYTFGGTEPTPLNLFLLDQFTGIAASHAALTALAARHLHGIGQDVHVSLLGSAMWLMQTNLVSSSINGKPADTTWNRKTISPVSNTAKAGDGKWFVGTNQLWDPRVWEAFTTAVGRPDLAEDPRYNTPQGRDAGIEELNETFDAIYLQHDRDEWLRILTDAGLKFAPVLDFQETLTHPQVTANHYVTDVDHPVLGPIRVPAHPVSFGKSAPPATTPAPVRIGEDTESVLERAGYTPEEIDDLIDAGIIRSARTRVA